LITNFLITHHWKAECFRHVQPAPGRCDRRVLSGALTRDSTISVDVEADRRQWPASTTCVMCTRTLDHQNCAQYNRDITVVLLYSSVQWSIHWIGLLQCVCYMTVLC